MSFSLGRPVYFSHAALQPGNQVQSFVNGFEHYDNRHLTTWQTGLGHLSNGCFYWSVGYLISHCCNCAVIGAALLHKICE